MADYAIHEETLTDVADVIRKKDGTSALIDPADYADRINLMGMLEEKTVSGAIAHFDDGADTVPLKSLVASIVPIGGKGTPQSPIAISGVDAVKITHTGKNMLNPATCQRGYIEGGGGIHVPQAYQELYSDYIKVKPDTTYTFSGTVNNSSDKWCGIAYYDKDKNFIIRQAVTTGTGEHFSIGYRTPSNAVYVRCTWRNYSDISSGGSVCPCQFEEGTETSYETYNGATYEVEIPNPNQNLFDKTGGTYTIGRWKTDGTVESGVGERAYKIAISEKTDYVIHGEAFWATTLSQFVVFFDANDTFISYAPLTPNGNTSKVTSPANSAYIGVTWEGLFQSVDDSVKEDFAVHGGQIDVISGEGESLCGKIVFDGSSDENWTAYAGGNGYLIAVADMERGTWYTSELAESYPLPKVPDNNSLGVRIGVNNNGIYVVQANTISGVTDLASFKAYLAENPLTVIYPLDDSETFTFDPVPIDSKSGNNTIWSEQGSDTEVTYRSMGTAYIYPSGEGVSF